MDEMIVMVENGKNRKCMIAFAVISHRNREREATHISVYFFQLKNVIKPCKIELFQGCKPMGLFRYYMTLIYRSILYYVVLT